MTEIQSNFIGDFKIGDNINYNLKGLDYLYSLYNSNKEEYAPLLKPIIITIVSIVEAVLFDFHKRVKTFTKEGVNELEQEVVEYIRTKQLDQFDVLIESMKKHNILNHEDKTIYDDMHLIRKIRNRIHIQNVKHELENDECYVFTEERKDLSELILEKILRNFVKDFSRGSDKNHVNTFILPWRSHLVD